MTRVLMFVPQYPYPVVGGLEKQAHELARALVAQGVPVQVLSGKINDDQPDREHIDDVPIVRISWPRRKVVRVLFAPLTIAVEIWRRRTTVDVIHLHQHSWISLYIILLAKLFGKPVISKLPNIGEFGLPGIRAGRLGALRQAILLSSDAMVAMSLASLEELMDAGYPRERVLLTPNGIALLEQPYLGSKSQEASGICRVVFVGRLTAAKQLDVLLEAWSQVSAEIGPGRASLDIWGDGPLAAELERRRDDLGLANNVRFAGHVADTARKLAAMDIFVLPSRAEGNSNAVLEAMVAALPVVSTPVGGTPMQVGAEGAEFLCPPGDVDALSALLVRLIADQGLRVEVGLAMRRRAEVHFDIRRVARTYAQAYEVLASGERDRIGGFANPVVTAGPAVLGTPHADNRVGHGMAPLRSK